MHQFRAFLLDWLDANRWTAKRLARESGINDSVIYRWLDADEPNRPTETNLRRLSKTVGLSTIDLMRMCDYLPASDFAEQYFGASDPRLQRIVSSWSHLPESVRQVMEYLANARTATLEHDKDGLGQHRLTVHKNCLERLVFVVCQAVWGHEFPLAGVDGSAGLVGYSLAAGTVG